MFHIVGQIKNIDLTNKTYKEDLTKLWTELYNFERTKNINNEDDILNRYGDIDGNLLMCEIGTLEDQKIYFNDQKPTFKSTPTPTIKEVYSKDEIESLLDHIVILARARLKTSYKDFENESLIGECVETSYYLANILQLFNIDGYVINSINAFDSKIGHAFVYTEVPTYDGIEPYIMDLTFRQFFLLSKCNKDRIYHYTDNMISPGYFIDQTIANQILKKGYVKLNKKTAKAYIESFRENKDQFNDEAYTKCIQYGKKLR